jgi:multicomponent Na+:H+ antiporter subunit D
MFAAPLAILLRRGNAAWVLALAVTWVASGISLVLLFQVLNDGPIRYFFGGWAPPWGIEYRIDALNAFVLVIIGVVSAAVLLFAGPSVRKEIREGHQHLFYALVLLLLAGLFGIAITGDAFNVFVFLEISSLASYALIAMGKDRRALTAAFQYLVLGTVGATFILIGIGLLYAMTGTLNMADMAERVQGIHGSRTVLTAFAFLTVGIALKAAVFPLHYWLPGAYAYAPSVVSALLAGTATKVAVYLLLRFIMIFGADFAYVALPLGATLAVLAAVGILIASSSAILQNDAKRLLAFSSVAHLGYIILGIGLGNDSGVTGGILHMFNHALAKGAVFLAMGAVMLQIGSTHINKLRGLGRIMPWTMAGFTAAGLSLIGVPLTAGFISKWYIVTAAIDRGWWPLALVMVASSILAVFYIWRIIDAVYFSAPGPGNEAIKEAPLIMLAPLWVLAGASVYFGIDSSFPASVAGKAAAIVLAQMP